MQNSRINFQEYIFQKIFLSKIKAAIDRRHLQNHLPIAEASVELYEGSEWVCWRPSTSSLGYDLKPCSQQSGGHARRWKREDKRADANPEQAGLIRVLQLRLEVIAWEMETEGRVGGREKWTDARRLRGVKSAPDLPDQVADLSECLSYHVYVYHVYSSIIEIFIIFTNIDYRDS